MINNWKKITQDNKVRLIIPILIAVLGVIGYFGKGWFESPTTLKATTYTAITQSTAGDSSPAVTGAKGDVTININSPDSEK